MVKSWVLQILRNYINKTPRVAEDADNILPRILTEVVDEYGASAPEARVPEVFGLLEVLCTKMEEPMAMALPQVFDGVFYPTVDMLRDDFDEFVTFRVPMFSFLRMLVEKYPSNLLSAPVEHFDALMGFIWWGCEHPTIDVSLVALQTIESMFRKVLESEAGPDVLTAFLAAYYLPTVTKVFQIMQDTHHKYAFDEEAKLLSTLFKIQAQQGHPDFITEQICPLFEQTTPGLVLEYVQKLVQKSNNKIEFRDLLRDFLVVSRQFSAKDPALRQAELEDLKARIRQEYYQLLNTEDGELA
jgi:exportin-1